MPIKEPPSSNFFRREKIIDTIALFSKHGNLLRKEKLYKLMYLMDFIHYRQAGFSVTGLEYYTSNTCPVPTGIDKEFKDERGILKFNKYSLYNNFNWGMFSRYDDGKYVYFFDIIIKKDYGGRYLTIREKEIINDLIGKFKCVEVDNIAEDEYLKNKPWHTTLKTQGENIKIDYNLSLDGSDEYELPEIEIKLRQCLEKDIEEMCNDS